MTEKEVIAKQATRIFELEAQVDDLKKRMERIVLHCVCIGGPLNDNVLGYSKAQLVTFARIVEEAEL